MHAISNPLCPGNGDLRVVLSGHLWAGLHVGHARSIRPVFDYRITGVEAQIKTKKKQYVHQTRFKRGNDNLTSTPITLCMTIKQKVLSLILDMLTELLMMQIAVKKSVIGNEIWKNVTFKVEAWVPSIKPGSIFMLFTGICIINNSVSIQGYRSKNSESIFRSMVIMV